MIIKKSIDSSKYDCRCMINMTCYSIMIIVLISLVLITGAPQGVEIPWPIRPIWPTPAKSALRILGKAQHIQVTLYLFFFWCNMLHNLDLSTFNLDILFTFKVYYCSICIVLVVYHILNAEDLSILINTTIPLKEGKDSRGKGEGVKNNA